MSITPWRTAPYSEDFRWRIIWQRIGLRLTVKTVANNLGVNASTVVRIVKIFLATGDVKKKKYPENSRPTKKLTNPVKLHILHLVLQHPAMYLKEVREELCAITGVDLCPSSLCTFLKQSNFTRQKMQLVAKQRDEELRKQYAIDVSLYEPHMIVFVDESGSDRRDTLRKYGYSLRGKTPKSCQFLSRGERINVIAGMTTEGIQALKIIRRTVDGSLFTDFVEQLLVPILNPFNGTSSNSVVIMDNCSIHHVSGIESLITQTGALLHYLPPYSPDLNPIEECFSKVKGCLKDSEVSTDLETAILASFTHVTSSDCQGWIKDSKVYD